MISIKVETSKLENILSPSELKSALRHGYRESIRGILPYIDEKVRARFTIKPSTLSDRRRREIKAKSTGESAEIYGVGRNIGLAQYKHSPRQPMTGKTSGGVTVSVARGESRNYPHAFTMKNNSNVGHGIYRRAGSSRYPVKQLKGASLEEMLESKSVYEPVRERILMQFDDAIAKELSK